ncbi:DUF4917 family protein [Brevundimonas sp. S30B]|uniref:DUF4917 family protein n=1 Tax=unclassified Brevundimonas TaxID=2622653 RepID=UPI001071A329|nr:MULTISPECIES: DUF4917 family protein [unclassified Brevundimonas]QBX36294.1 DUF4917 family protein [Brevundimonas sp. MF30-B]TFW01002.1 DUF4917 family protein [Brevundimonas sp. S30B]
MPGISFQEALRRSENQKRHLLLGNGFSIALFADRFRYASLLESTDFSHNHAARQAFDALGTTDFEVVIQALRQMVTLGSLYGLDERQATQIANDAEALKELLVQAIAGRHPDRPSEINEGQYASCRRFLAHFGGEGRRGRPDRRGHIYTLNYDLLLYWTLLHDHVLRWDEANPLAAVFEPTEVIRHDDGFRAPPDDWDAPYVTWDGEANHSQCVFFLHGALHLFDHGFDLQKICWERAGGRPLVDQVREALDGGQFPLFVSEGSSASKLNRIRHSGYLHKGLRSFSEICRKEGSALFVFGHSLAANDVHILDHIVRGRVPVVYVSMFGNEDTEENRALAANAEQLVRSRGEQFPLEVVFYDAASAHVWN